EAEHPMMTGVNEGRATARIANSGLVFILISSVGWGLNWPVMKHLLTEWPPLSARGLSGVVGGGLLLVVSIALGQSLRVPRDQWGRLVLSAVLNVGSWVTFMGLAFLVLSPRGSAAIAHPLPRLGAVLA